MQRRLSRETLLKLTTDESPHGVFQPGHPSGGCGGHPTTNHPSAGCLTTACTPRPPRASGRYIHLLVWLLLCASWLGTDPAWASEEQEAKGLVESIAALTYAAAWPTATYTGASIKSVDPVIGGYDIRVKLSGKSAWSDGDLWLELVFQVRRGGLDDVKVKRHNAILSPPFATTQALGQLLADLANETTTQQQTSTLHSGDSGQGFRFYVTNDCRLPIKLAVKYRRLDGEWSTVGWWSFAGNSSRYLAFNGGEWVRTDASTVYYYAETSDGSLFWGDNSHRELFEGKTLPMSSVYDKNGDTEFSLSCPGK